MDDLTYLQFVAIFGLFATLPFARSLFTGQLLRKRMRLVVKAQSERLSSAPGGGMALKENAKILTVADPLSILSQFTTPKQETSRL